MPAIIDALLYGWDKNLDYARKLVADLPDDKLAFQPAPRMNHPAWIFSHLNLYHPVMVAILRSQPFEDPKTHPFGMQSKPTASRADYPSKQALIDTYAKGHDEVAAAIKVSGEAKLLEPPPLERWRNLMPVNATLFAYLMLVHESTHLGQLSAWRRVQGLPNV